MFKNRKVKKSNLDLGSPKLETQTYALSPRTGESEVDALVRQLVKIESIAEDQRKGYQRWWKIDKPHQARDQIQPLDANKDIQQLDRDSGIERRNMRGQGGRNT